MGLQKGVDFSRKVQLPVLQTSVICQSCQTEVQTDWHVLTYVLCNLLAFPDTHLYYLFKQKVCITINCFSYLFVADVSQSVFFVRCKYIISVLYTSTRHLYSQHSASQDMAVLFGCQSIGMFLPVHLPVPFF